MINNEFRHYNSTFLAGLRKPQDTSVRIVSVPANILFIDFMNTHNKYYC